MGGLTGWSLSRGGRPAATTTVSGEREAAWCSDRLMVKSVLFLPDPPESGVVLWTAAVHRTAAFEVATDREKSVPLGRLEK